MVEINFFRLIPVNRERLDLRIIKEAIKEKQINSERWYLCGGFIGKLLCVGGHSHTHPPLEVVLSSFHIFWQCASTAHQARVRFTCC